MGKEIDDMTEGDIWNHVKKVKKEKKWSNVEQSLAWLTRKGIPFVALNASVCHYRVAEVWDFWPSTGKFHHMKTGESGRGVLQLMKKINNGNK